jgi:hypothetical protein
MMAGNKGLVYTRKDAKPCLGCGLPTNSTYGYCQRNPECTRKHRSLLWAATMSPSIGRAPIYCLSCGREFPNVVTKFYVCVQTPECVHMLDKIRYTLRKLKVNDHA